MQFFTWDCKHPEMSWWKHFETEVPALAELGITQVWLPPPNKAMRKVSRPYVIQPHFLDISYRKDKDTTPTTWYVLLPARHVICS